MIATAQPTSDDDQLLAERAGKGDHAAFNTIFERYRGRIYRFCRLMLGSEAAAADIYQDVFILFYRACRNGQQMHNVQGYLIAVARTRCLTSLREVKRMTSIDEDQHMGYEIDETAPDTGIHLQQALMAIAPQYREAFLLFEVEGYTYEEIGRQLGVTHDVVKNRIYRAKQALQKILGPLLGEL